MTEFRRSFLTVLAYVIAIFAATYLINAAGFLENVKTATFVFWGASLVVTACLVMIGLLKFGTRNHYAWLYLGIFSIIFLMASLNLPEPKMRLHFIEYGILFVLIYRMLSVKMAGFWPYGLAILLTSVFGVVDELFQSFIPHAVMDYGDALNNTFAGYMAGGLTFIWKKI